MVVVHESNYFHVLFDRVHSVPDFGVDSGDCPGVGAPNGYRITTMARYSLGHRVPQRHESTQRVFLADLDRNADSVLVLAEPHVVFELDLKYGSVQRRQYRPMIHIRIQVACNRWQFH